MFAVVGGGLVLGRLPGHAVMPPSVSALGKRHGLAGALEHNHMLHGRGARQGAVHVGLQLNNLPPAPSAIGGDDELGLAVVDPVLDRLAGEAPKDDRVDQSEARTRQHRHCGLRHHRQVDGHPVALGQTERGQGVRHLADFAVQLLVGDRADVPRLTFENNRSLVLARRAEVTVQTVGCDIQTSA